MKQNFKAVLGAAVVATVVASSAFATIPAQTTCSYYFSNNMKYGMVSSDVMNLQKVLNMDARTQVAATGAGSAGQETMRFGPATFAAVKKFQALNGVSPVSGYAAVLTRGVLNTICQGGTVVVPVATTTPGNVTTTSTNVVASNIPVGVLVQGQASAKIAEFVVTGNGNVVALELMRTGVSNNTTLKNVYLYDGATRLTDAASVLTDGTIRFNNVYGLFSVNGSKTLIVRADIENLTAGQTVGVAMKSVTLQGSAATPVVAQGPLFSIASASTAGVTFNGSNTVSSATVNAGTLAYNTWGSSFSVSSRAVRLHGMTFKMVGSAPANSLANVKLFIDGVQAGTAGVNAMGMLVFDMTANPMVLNTGGHTVELRADVVAGANRSFYMSLENIADVMLEDTSLPGVFVTPVNYSNVKNAGTITINTGNLTINQDSTFTTTNVVGGATNVTIGSFKVTSYGEDVKLQTINVNPVLTGTTPAAAGLNNVALYVNGGQVGSSQNFTSGTLTWNLGSQFIAMAGTPVTLEVKADMVTNANVTYSAGQVRTDIVAVTNGGQGVQSSNLVNIPGTAGKTLTINGSNPTFSKSSGFISQSVAPNQTVKIGSFILQNGAVEDITVNNLVVNLSGTMALTNLSNLTIKDGSTVVGNPFGTVSASNNFSTSGLVVAKNSSKTFDVYADLGSTTGVSITADMGTTYRGNTSFVNTTVSPATGIATSVGVASLAASVNAAAVEETSQYVVGGTMKKIVTYKVVSSTNVSAAISRMVFNVTSADAIQSVKVNGVTASVAAGVADVTGLNITVPGTAAGVLIPVEVTYSCFIGSTTGVGCNLSNTPATPRTAQVTLTTVEALSGGTSVNLTGLSLASNPMSLVASKPTVTPATSNLAGLVQSPAGTKSVKVGEVTVAADAAGDINVTQIKWNTGVAGGAAIVSAEVKEGNTAITGATCTAAGVCTFGTPSTITAGQSKTYSLFAEVSPVTGAANTVSVSTSVDQAGFMWTDITGNSPAQTGTAIYNFPTSNTYSIHN
jgi:hypothetical protein